MEQSTLWHSPIERKLINPSKQQLLLLGAGHLHWVLMRDHGHRLCEHFDITWVDPGLFWYSGMAAGVVVQRYAVSQATANPKSAAYPLQVCRGHAMHVDTESRLVTLADGSDLAYDYLSINVGSQSAMNEEWRGLGAVGVQPLSGLLQKVDELKEPERIVIVGGGVTGCELAATLAQRAEQHQITVYSADARLGKEWGRRAGKKFLAKLGRLGVEVLLNRKLTPSEGRELVRQGCQLFFAGGLAAPSWLQSIDSSTDQRGLPVKPNLQSRLHDNVFAGGNCAHFVQQPLPKAGVFAVKQAPVMAHNLLAAQRGKRLRQYQPQPWYLGIADLGDTGLMKYGPICMQARWALRWKRYLDCKFMQSLLSDPS